jgi:glutathione S-transferase
MSIKRPVVYHIPVCPFSQRLEILLALKGCSDAVEFRLVDVTRPRDPELLLKTRGTTALPVLETAGGRIQKESLVILRYLDETTGVGPLRRADPYEHAVESMLIARESAFTMSGYMYVMNQDAAQRDIHNVKLLNLYRDLSDFLAEHSPEGPFLFEEFGLAEVVFTPLFMRFWFLDYYEDFELPSDAQYARVRKWRDACLEQKFAQQVSREEIIKLYYDYALGSGNGKLPEGRSLSSFSFNPHWRDRPWPPRQKYGAGASDLQLGLTRS